jgi:ABC-type multidrug transport system fused ATPase/permease subunit
MTPFSTFLRLFRYFVKYKWRVLTGLVSVTIMSLSETANAYLISMLINVLQKISEQIRLGMEVHMQVDISPWNKLLYTFMVNGKNQSFELIYKFAIAAMVIIAIKVVFVYFREYLIYSTALLCFLYDISTDIKLVI